MSFEYNTGGSAGLKFVEDITSILDTNWIPAIGGKKPEIVPIWKFKESGLSGDYQIIIIHLDDETVRIFSMMQGATNENATFSYDWLHNISVTLEIRTGTSERRVLQLTDMCTYILKNNVLPIVNNRQYVQLLPEGYVPMSEEYRNLYKTMLSATAMRFNP